MARLVPIIALAFVGGVLFAIQAALATDKLPEKDAANFTRACSPAVGASAVTLAATTSADADSGALSSNSVYMMQCDTAAWIRWGSSAVTAVADDWLQPAGVVSFFWTGGVSQDAIHVSALSQTSDGDCRLLRCY